MPDVTTHLSVSLFSKKPLGMKSDYRIAILGCILPDLFRPLYILFVDFLKLDADQLLLYFEGYHSPFTMILFSFAISLYCKTKSKSFISLSFFSILHCLLDSLIIQKGFHGLLLYPFYYGPLPWQIIDYSSPWLVVASILSLPTIIYLLWVHHPKALFNWPSKKAMTLSFILVGITIFSVISFQNILLNRNVVNVDFHKNPNKYLGDKVVLTLAEIKSKNPTVVQKMNRFYELKNTAVKEDVGDMVFVEGIYQGEYFTDVEVSSSGFFYTKVYFSLFGLFAFCLVFLKGIFKDKKNYYASYSTAIDMDLSLVESFKTIKSWVDQYRRESKTAEIGCGTGYISNYIGATGIDISSDAIDIANRNFPNNEFYLGSYLTWPERKEVKCVVCHNILEHLPNHVLDEFLKEFTSNEQAIYIFGYSDPFHPVQILWGWLTDKVWFDETHINNWSVSKFKKVLAKHFELIKVKRTSPFTRMLSLGQHIKGDVLILARAK